MADDQNTQVRMGDLQLEGMPSWNQQDFGSGDTNSLTSPSGFDVSIASPPALDASPNGPTTIGADGIPRYANGEPISKRTLQNRRSQKEFRLRRANYLKELEEKCRRYESEESLANQALHREVIQLREENDFLRSQLARLHADPNVVPMGPLVPTGPPRLSFSSNNPRSLPGMLPYGAAQFPPFPLPPNAPPPHLVHPGPGEHPGRPRSPGDPKIRSPFGMPHEGPPIMRGRQPSLGGPQEPWTGEAGQMRSMPPTPTDGMSGLGSPPNGAPVLRQSNSSPISTSPQWYQGPQSATLPMRSWITPPLPGRLPPVEPFPGLPTLHSPTSVHPPGQGGPS